MRTSPGTLLASAACALLVAQAVLAQRSSPQFSFPPPNTLAAQFGGDSFSTNNQDLGPLSSSSQVGGATSAQAAQQASDQALVAASVAQSPQRTPASEQQQQQPSSAQAPQVSRPSLSLSSLSASVGQQSAQPQASRQTQQAGQQPASAPARSSSAASQTSGSQHQSSRQPGSSARASSNHAHANQLHTQQTSQSLNNAQSNLAAIEAARKAEATAASLAAASSGQSYHCPDSFGFFRHHKSCDKYWACENGTSTLKLCGNGLMFDDSDPKRENCAYPFSVDCGADRTDLEPPISTPHCPRLYGLFADTANCRVFYSCWNGEASKYECPPGLAYDNEQRVCVWADLVDRCDQSEVSDGFVCPDPTEVDQPGHYTRHAHPTDCRKFYVCIEGVARPYGCSFGTVFNVDSLQCDEPENVSGCEKYYGDLDPKLAKKLAKEGTQGQGSGAQHSSGSSSRSSSSAASSQANH